MRHNPDLDALELMRHRLRQQEKVAAERFEANKYMNPKTANMLLAGAAALTLIALPAAAMAGTATLIASAAAMGATVAVAAINKAKAVSMEVNREGFSNFIAKSKVYLKEHSEVYKAVKQQFESSNSPAVGADFIQYQKVLEQEIAATQEMAITQRQQERLEAQQRQDQNQGKSPKTDFDFSPR